jgi:hypothetical protein
MTIGRVVIDESYDNNGNTIHKIVKATGAHMGCDTYLVYDVEYTIEEVNEYIDGCNYNEGYIADIIIKIYGKND